MIASPCRRCGNTNIRKNGKTASGRQKYHCKACNMYGTLDPKEPERAAVYTQVEKLHLERLSQRAIARITGISRSTIIKLLKKSPLLQHMNR